MRYLFLLFLMMLGVNESLAGVNTESHDCNFPDHIKKALKGKEHTYCMNGKKLPLFRIDGQTAFHQKISIYLNGHKINEAIPPKGFLFGGTINEHLLIDKKNVLRVDYEIVKYDLKIPGAGVPTFRLDIFKQVDWKDSSSAVLVISVNGPDKSIREIGYKGTVEVDFTPSNTKK